MNGNFKMKWMRLVNLVIPSAYEDTFSEFSRKNMYEECKKGLLVETKEDLVNNYLKECRRLIRDRVNLHHFHKTLKVPDSFDEESFMKIQNYFEELGFTVVNLAQVTSGEIGIPYLFIYWGNTKSELDYENTISE